MPYRWVRCGSLKPNWPSLENILPELKTVLPNADFVIKGCIDPIEPLRDEGPFGDHTGYYTLPEPYPVFHVTAITHRQRFLQPCCALADEVFFHHENFDRARGQPKPGSLVATRDERGANRHS